MDDYLVRLLRSNEFTENEKMLAKFLHNGWIMWLVGIVFAAGGLFYAQRQNSVRLDKTEVSIEGHIQRITTLEAVVPRIEKQMSDMNFKLDRISERIR